MSDATQAAVRAADDAIFATWAPDGQTLAFIHRDFKDPEKSGLYVVAKPGDEGRQVFSGAIISPAQAWRTISWASNNTILVQTSDKSIGQGKRFVLLHLGTK